MGYYDNGTTYFAHSDWLGTARTYTMTSGAVSNSTPPCTNLPFGDAQNCTGIPWYLQSFTGDQHDNEDNLEHTLNRQLSTTEGRWLTPDPAGMAAADPGDPQSWNRYAYVMNNPINAVDPTGLYAADYCYFGDGATIGIDGHPRNTSAECQYMDASTGAADQGIGDGGDGIFTKEILGASDWGSTENDSGLGDWIMYENGGGDHPSGTGGPIGGDTNYMLGRDDGLDHSVQKMWHQTSSYLKTVPVNLTVIVPVLGIVGPAVTVTYLPQTHNLCVAPGLGASVGRNVSAGPLILGNLSNAKAITEGASISVGAQALPIAGAQATGNFSGILGGPTVGIPGGSVTATYGICF